MRAITVQVWKCDGCGKLYRRRKPSVPATVRVVHGFDKETGERPPLPGGEWPIPCGGEATLVGQETNYEPIPRLQWENMKARHGYDQIKLGMR